MRPHQAYIVVSSGVPPVDAKDAYHLSHKEKAGLYLSPFFVWFFFSVYKIQLSSLHEAANTVLNKKLFT